MQLDISVVEELRFIDQSKMLMEVEYAQPPNIAQPVPPLRAHVPQENLIQDLDLHSAKTVLRVITAQPDLLYHLIAHLDHSVWPMLELTLSVLMEPTLSLVILKIMLNVDHVLLENTVHQV